MDDPELTNGGWLEEESDVEITDLDGPGDDGGLASPAASRRFLAWQRSFTRWHWWLVRIASATQQQSLIPLHDTALQRLLQTLPVPDYPFASGRVSISWQLSGHLLAAYDPGDTDSEI